MHSFSNCDLYLLLRQVSPSTYFPVKCPKKKLILGLMLLEFDSTCLCAVWEVRSFFFGRATRGSKSIGPENESRPFKENANLQAS